MRRLSAWWLFPLFAISLCLESVLLPDCEAASIPEPSAGIPYYFLAIHNEPFHDVPGGPEQIAESYRVLEAMVARADDYDIKLTLMFTPQWGHYIAADPARRQALREWAANGHEIAAHHHSVYHGNWDGYSNYAPVVALDLRRERGADESYLGTLDDYMAVLVGLNLDMKSGCVNDEADKHVMPDTIIYDTCSGFANFGEAGRELPDGSPLKGINEFVSVGWYKGIRRSWLTHFQTTTLERQLQAQEVFLSLTSGVYGSVNHSSPRESEAFFAYLDFLHAEDPGGVHSRTVAGVIEQGLLPEAVLEEDFRPRHLCGDRICDLVEQRNPRLCPLDCGQRPIEPDIRANGSDGPLQIGSQEGLELVLGLDAGDAEGRDADQWLAIHTPSGDWRYFTPTGQWRDAGSDQGALRPAGQGPLYTRSFPKTLMVQDLAAGLHDIYFGVDLNSNGILDAPFHYDRVQVKVSE